MMTKPAWSAIKVASLPLRLHAPDGFVAVFCHFNGNPWDLGEFA